MRKHHVFDIYIPEEVQKYQDIQCFYSKINQLVQGATVYKNISGKWNGQIEEIRILRIAIEIEDSIGNILFDVDNLREGLKGAAIELMAELQSKHNHKENAVFFNDWPCQGTLITHFQQALSDKRHK